MYKRVDCKFNLAEEIAALTDGGRPAQENEERGNAIFAVSVYAFLSANRKGWITMVWSVTGLTGEWVEGDNWTDKEIRTQF